MTDVDGAADASSPLALAQAEDEHSRQEWEAAAAAVLRKTRKLAEDEPDSAVWEKLTRTTLDGIAIHPLGVPGAPEPAVRPSRVGGWDIRSLIAHPEAKIANEEALADLDGGVTSLWVAADETTDLATVLAEVLLDLAPVVLDAPTAPTAAARALLACADERGVDLHPDSNLGADPLGAMLRELPLAVDEAVAELRDLAAQATEAGVRAVVVDATAAHDLGASDVQELAWSIAAGVAYLRWLTDHGVDLAGAANLIEFRYAATDEQFPTIAKLRAARQLWGSVLQHSGLPADVDVAQRQHVVTSRPMLSKYDPYVNMLRGTVAAFAAGVGGADAVTVLPFDAALGRPEALRPPHRPQRQSPADRRVPRRRGRRPGGRRLRRRAAHGRPRRRGVGCVPRARGGVGGRPRPHPVPRADRVDGCRARAPGRPPSAAADRRHRVPEPRRGPSHPGSRPVERPGCALRRRLRGDA